MDLQLLVRGSRRYDGRRSRAPRASSGLHRGPCLSHSRERKGPIADARHRRPRGKRRTLRPGMGPGAHVGAVRREPRGRLSRSSLCFSTNCRTHCSLIGPGSIAPRGRPAPVPRCVYLTALLYGPARSCALSDAVTRFISASRLKTSFSRRRTGRRSASTASWSRQTRRGTCSPTLRMRLKRSLSVKLPRWEWPGVVEVCRAADVRALRVEWSTGAPRAWWLDKPPDE